MSSIYEGAFIAGWALKVGSGVGIISVLFKMGLLAWKQHYVESYKKYWISIGVLFIVGLIGGRVLDFGETGLDREQQKQEQPEWQL